MKLFKDPAIILWDGILEEDWGMNVNTQRNLSLSLYLVYIYIHSVVGPSTDIVCGYNISRLCMYTHIVMQYSDKNTICAFYHYIYFGFQQNKECLWTLGAFFRLC